MLGPRRFNDISKVTLEALYRFRDAEELSNLKTALTLKDEEIATLLNTLNRLEGKPTASLSPEKVNYDDLDLNKAKRLIVARDMRIKNLKGRIEKLQKEEEEELPDLPTKWKPASGASQVEEADKET